MCIESQNLLIIMKKVDPAQIATSIKYFRQRAGLSQMELEINANISHGSISRIENVEVEPSIETRFKIAEVLDLTIKETAYLMGINLYDKTIIKSNSLIGERGKSFLSKEPIDSRS